jgi:hypothetical protein
VAKPALEELSPTLILMLLPDIGVGLSLRIYNRNRGGALLARGNAILDPYLDDADNYYNFSLFVAIS